MTVAIIDYGSGNLHSVCKAFQLAGDAAGLPVTLTADPDAVRAASHIVLPGVGAFGDCVAGLRAVDGMKEALQEQAIDQQTPFLGVCVGMQMMLDSGLEHGEHQGFGWINGQVVPILEAESRVQSSESSDRKESEPVGSPLQSPDRALGSSRRPVGQSGNDKTNQNPSLRIPHMGWNELTLNQPDHPLFDGVASGEHVYFVHSYHALCDNEAECLATTDYGKPLTACVGRDNLVGVQFHPEKSQSVGLKLIANFLKMG